MPIRAWPFSIFSEALSIHGRGKSDSTGIVKRLLCALTGTLAPRCGVPQCGMDRARPTTTAWTLADAAEVANAQSAGWKVFHHIWQDREGRASPV